MRASTLWIVAFGAAACAAVAEVLPVEGPEPEVTPDPQLEPEPDPEPILDDPVVDLSVANISACVTRESGRIHCWGKGAMTHVMSKDLVEHGDLDDVVLTTGMHEQGCVLHDDGGVSCWGLNHHRQFGGALERNETTSTPVRLPHVHDAIALSSGHHHLCVLTDEERVACWGEPYGQALGPDIRSSDEPVLIDLPDARIVDVSASMEQVCAVGASGRVWCWGDLGFRNHPLADPSGRPVQIPLDFDAASVSAGFTGGCAVGIGGEAACWGFMLGDLGPTSMELPPVVTVDVGWNNRCALLEDSSVWCAEPVPDGVAGRTGFTHVAISDSWSCAAHAVGEIACWDAEGIGWTVLEDG